MSGVHAVENRIQVVETMTIKEKGRERAASLHQFGGRFVENALAAATKDACVVRSEVRSVENPGSVFIRVIKADPLMDINGLGLRSAHSGASYCQNAVQPIPHPPRRLMDCSVGSAPL